MEFKETNKTKINFQNKPRVLSHEGADAFNERMISFVPIIQEFITNHPRFKDLEVNVSFAHRGVSSLVSIIETPKEKVVLKIRLSTDGNNSEAVFLKVWSQVGVKVPQVFEDGTLEGHPYALMEFIDAPILSDEISQNEMIKKGLSFKLGNILHTMHQPQTQGFGKVINGKSEYLSFKEWPNKDYTISKFNYVKERKLLGEEHGSLDKAIQILVDYVGDNKSSSYCHNDFGTNNMFATDPITIFDPDPILNIPYYDVGRSVHASIAHSGAFPQEFIDGYFTQDKCNMRILHASILLNAYMKFTYWNKTGQQKGMNNIKDYLIKNKHLLD